MGGRRLYGSPLSIVTRVGCSGLWMRDGEGVTMLRGSSRLLYDTSLKVADVDLALQSAVVVKTLQVSASASEHHHLRQSMEL